MLAQHHPKSSHQVQPQIPLQQEEVSENVGWDSRTSTRCFILDLLKIKFFLKGLQPQGQDNVTKAASHGDKAVALTDTHTHTCKSATQPFPYHWHSISHFWTPLFSVKLFKGSWFKPNLFPGEKRPHTAQQSTSYPELEPPCSWLSLPLPWASQWLVIPLTSLTDTRGINVMFAEG